MVSLCQDILALSQELNLPMVCPGHHRGSTAPGEEQLKAIRFPKEVMPLPKIVFL